MQKVRDWMIKDVYKVTDDTSVYDAVKHIVYNKAGVLPVINKNEEPVGIISERDILKKVVLKQTDPTKVSVGKIMTKKLYTVSPDESIFKAFWIMDKKSIKQTPVVEKRKLIGLITLRDIMKKLSS